MAALRGVPKDAAPPRPKFLHFHAVFGRNSVKIGQIVGWRTPFWEILDPPLLFITKNTLGVKLPLDTLDLTPVQQVHHVVYG